MPLSTVRHGDKRKVKREEIEQLLFCLGDDSTSIIINKHICQGDWVIISIDKNQLYFYKLAKKVEKILMKRDHFYKHQQLQMWEEVSTKL